MATTQISTPEKTADRPEKRPVIVYFDGVCGFCNGAVNFLMKNDPAGHLVYAPLQGDTARSQLAPADVAELNTLIVTENGKNYRRSAAVVRVLVQLGLLWRILGGLLWLVPLPVRDFGYRLIAKNRYRFFGKHAACRIPSPNERDRFLP